MSVALESEKEDIYQISEDDELLDATRIQMVLGSLEKSLVDLIYKDVHNFDIKSGAGNKAYKSFVQTYRREPNDDFDLIRKCNLSQLPGIAKQCLSESSQRKHLERLDQLINSLQIYKSRSLSFAHPGNQYHPVHWARVQALALDPVIKNLGFFSVVERYYAAKQGNLDRVEVPQEEWNEIPNNLPNPDYDEIIGRDKLSKEIKEYLINPRKPSISIFGAGGTGKTALTLSVLNEIKYCENNSGEFDFILFSSLKDEFLEEGLVRKEVVDLTINGIKSQFMQGFDFTNQNYNSELFDEDFIFDTNADINDNWKNFIENFATYKFLLWVDNLETLSNDIYEEFANFESSLPRDWKIIVTSRIRIRESSSIISLGPLEVNNAAQLFQKIYKEKLGKKIEFEDAIKFSEKLFCNPLAIKNAIGFQKKNNSSLIESVKCGAESIISFSYKKLVSSLSQRTKDVLEVLFVFGEQRKLDINKRIDIDIDSVSESISEIEDLGLASRGTSTGDFIKLNDNFRSYLSINPLNDDLRYNLNLFKEEKLNTNITPSEAENNKWSNQMRFSYLKPSTQVDDTCRLICNEAIGALGRHYKIKENLLIDNETKDEAFDLMRNSLKELEEILDSSSIGDAPPAVYRLMGLIYQEFNDQAMTNKFLNLAADFNDPNALLTLFYKFNGLKDERAEEFGFRFYDSLNRPLPDNIPFAKFMTAFTRLLSQKNKFEDVINLTDDFSEKTPRTKFLYLIIRAEAYSRISNNKVPNLLNETNIQDVADEISDLFVKAYESYDLCSFSPDYPLKRLQGLCFWYTSVNNFTKKSLTKKLKISFKEDLLKAIKHFKEEYFDQAYNERYLWIERNCQDNKRSGELLKLEISKEYLEDLYQNIKSLKIQKRNFLNPLEYRWFMDRKIKVRFLKYTGFDKKFAVFEDDNNTQFLISGSKYSNYLNKSNSIKNKIPKFYKLNRNSSIIVRVLKYYLNHKVYDRRNEILEIYG